MNSLKLSFIALPIFIVLDLLWIGAIANLFYAGELASFVRRTGDTIAPNWWGTAIGYICMTIGVVFFVAPKFVEREVGWSAFLWGALMGLVVYGVYEFTNYGLLVNWPIRVVIVDVLWGMVIYGITSFATVWLGRRFNML